MKHLRYLVIVLCFALLPAVIVDRGVNYYTDVEAERLQERVSRQLEEYLRNISYRFETGEEQRDTLRELNREFVALPPLDADSARKWLDSVRQRFGDMFYPLVFFNDAAGKRQEILPADLKNKFLYRKLDEFLQLPEEEKGSFPPSQLKLIQRQILGADGVEPRSFYSAITTPKVIRGQGPYRQMTTHYNDRIRDDHGWLYLLHDPDEVKRRFSLERQLIRAGQDLETEEIRFALIHPEGTPENKLVRANPAMKELLATPPHVPVTLTGQRDMLAVASQRTDTGKIRLIVAWRPLESVYPGRDVLIGNTRLLLVVTCLLFMVVFGMTHYGIIRLFISIRLQLVAILFLSAVLPLSALMFMGIRYLDSFRENLVQQTYNDMEKQIRGLDEDFVMRLDKMRLIAMDVVKHEATDDALGFLKDVSLTDWKQGDHLQFRRYFERYSTRLVKLQDESLVYDWWIFGPNGELLYSCDKHTNIAENMLLGGMSAEIVRQKSKKPRKQGATTDLEKEVYNAIMMAYKEQIMDDVMTDLTRIRPIKLGRVDWKLFIHPVYGPDGEPVAVAAMNFSLDHYKNERLKKFVADFQRADSPFTFAYQGYWFQWGRNRIDEKKLQCLPEPVQKRVSGLLSRVAAEQMPLRRIIPAGSDEYMISCLPLKQMENFTVAGSFPMSEIEKSVHRVRTLFLAACLLSLVLAILIALVVSAKFIRPVRSVQSGVRAITEGDLSYRMHIDSQDELGELSRTFNRMVGGLQEKERMSRYVSEFVLDEVKKDTSDEGQGEEKKASVLFSDIRGFTTLSETYPPGEIVAMLNDYLDVMTRVILANGGVVDKFIGDAVMAVFYPDHPKGARGDESRAVLAALQMRAELSRFNERRRAAGRFEVDNGIGVNTGEVIRGSIGSQEHRVDLTVIGDHVNLAARLEGLSKEGQHTHIIISDRTWEAVRDFVDAVPFGERTVKGKTKSVALFEVVGLRTAAEYLPRLTDEDPSIRREGLRLLSVVADPSSLAPVLECLDDNDAGVRSEAATALGRLVGNSPEAMERLVDRLRRETDARVKANLIRVIGETGPDHLRLALHPYLEDEDPRVRANTVEAMGQAADRAGLIRVLSVYREDENNRIRANACVMLWSLGVADVVVDLLAMIAHRQPLMRASGAWGIGEIAGRERVARMRAAAGQSGADLDASLFERLDNCLDGLHRLLDDPDAMVLRNAIKALGRMGNRQSSHRLIRKYQEVQDEELRLIILGALDEIGAGHIVREARHGVTGGRV